MTEKRLVGKPDRHFPLIMYISYAHSLYAVAELQIIYKYRRCLLLIFEREDLEYSHTLLFFEFLSIEVFVYSF